MQQIKTGSWFGILPAGHIRIGISRGIPRNMPSGYRVMKSLSPGPWFNSVGVDEYYELFRDTILGPKDPAKVVAGIEEVSRGLIPVMVCYEKPNDGTWCHRAMVAEWLNERLGMHVPEVGFEHLVQAEHPLMPKELRKPSPPARPPEADDDVTPYIGKRAVVNDQTLEVIGLDEKHAGQAVVKIIGTDRTFSTTLGNLRRYF